MKKIVAFGASNSRHSINKQLATWVGQQGKDAEVTLLDLNDYEMPIYGIDREKESGIPELAVQFKELIKSSDGIIISFAEHNGSFATAFKNVLDWISRLDKPIWSNKPMFILATSPGGRGGMSVLGGAEKTFPHQGAKVAGVFSLPSFKQNFDNGIIDETLLGTFNQQLASFQSAINSDQTEEISA